MKGANKFVNLAEIERKRPTYLFEPMLLEGVVNLVAGEGGIGKSSLVLDWAAKASRGELMGDFKGAPVTVLMYAPEDSDARLRSRLEAAGADLSKIIPFYKEETSTLPSGEKYAVRSGYTLPADINYFQEAIVQHNAKVLVVDPITDLIGGDSNKRDDVRKALSPLAALAERLHVNVIGIMHFNKGGGTASHKLSGSHAFRDICRSLVLVAQDTQTGERVATLDKNNYSSQTQVSWSFTIESVALEDTDGKPEEVGRVTNWKQSSKSVQEVINSNETQAIPQKHTPNECQSALVSYLESRGRAAPKDEAIAALTQEGFTSSQIEHARQRSNSPRILSTRGGYPATAIWYLEVDRLANPDNPPNINVPHLPSKEREKPEESTVSNSSSSLSSLAVDMEGWEQETLSKPACDTDYYALTDTQLRILADSTGLYAAKAWDEQHRRNGGRQ